MVDVVRLSWAAKRCAYTLSRAKALKNSSQFPLSFKTPYKDSRESVNRACMIWANPALGPDCL